MRDFSIRSILANTIAIGDEYENCQSRKNDEMDETTDSGISATRMCSTRQKHHLPTENRPDDFKMMNLRKNSDIDTQRFLNGQIIYECSQRNDKSPNNSNDHFDTDTDGKQVSNDLRKFLERVPQNKFHSNQVNDEIINVEVEAPGKARSKRYFFTEFNLSGKCVNNNLSNEQQRRNSARTLGTNNKIKCETHRGRRDHWQINRSNENRGSKLLGQPREQSGHLIIDAKSDCLSSNIPKNNQHELFKGDTESLQVLQNKFKWLHCTRYKPPTVPRKSRSDKHKRRDGLQPRIPISMFQLDILERKYCNGAYLSRNDLLELSSTLKLPPKKLTTEQF
ncbi:uncharacterized protein LOC117224493 [Megalopta genalis]|uniref:uncharacterized protein LOC117224493 n=1 Tax=Megalopta genalis TaxID=115081 RepID=UPI003FD00423